jgi:hypothetical protein
MRALLPCRNELGHHRCTCALIQPDNWHVEDLVAHSGPAGAQHVRERTELTLQGLRPATANWRLARAKLSRHWLVQIAA